MTSRWTRKARREFDQAFEHLHEANADAAVRWRSDVGSMQEMIEHDPAIGRSHRRDRDGEIREVVVGRYRIVYRIAPDLLEIRRVLHVRRDYDPDTIREGMRGGSPAFVPA
ncbi:MAG TPA: type II toxin-antitoxin system RelE/ParE family toxin [Thermoanaerobaculia bacterium]|nr:type II toxin-antitoxin system RelE/ParE family toxin [Thermoanaerobaculia bacterium]